MISHKTIIAKSNQKVNEKTDFPEKFFSENGKQKNGGFSVLSLTENTPKLSLPFGQVKLSSIVKFTL